MSAGALAVAALLPTATPAPAQADVPRTATASALTDEVDRARADYDRAQERVAAIGAQAARLAERAADAEAQAARLRGELAEDDGGLVDSIGGLFDTGPSDLDLAAEAAGEATDARALADLAAGALTAEMTAAERARLAWERAVRRQQRVAARWSAEQAAEAAIDRARLAPAYDVADATQDRRNRRALREWHAYLRALGRAGVVPPAAAELDGTGRLPAPLESARDARGAVAPGLAVLDRPGRTAVTVLSTEAVRAVSDAFRRLGLPDVPGAIAPVDYACGGLVANAWSDAEQPVPADAGTQWTDLRTVPSRSVQPGDVVVVGRRTGGVEASGVALGGGQVVLADPETGVASVQPIPDAVLGVRRVAAAPDRSATAPAGGTCGTVADDAAPASTEGPLVAPVAAGSYTLTAGHGDSGARWSSGAHTGLDFAAPTGTPVVAAGRGTVTVEQPGWAGNLVRIDHGGGVETWYAHLSEVTVSSGDEVTAGAPVGAVGSLGNSSGPHLHFEVRLDDLSHDPATVLGLDTEQPAYPNGELPDDALCPASADGLHRLRCDAAVAYRLLAAAYAADRGAELCITDSYRSRQGQEQVFAAKPGLAAVPGTSVHGLGLAVDLCGGVERFDTPEHLWLLEHGPAYGWQHPAWAAAGGSRPEPWHFEYGADR